MHIKFAIDIFYSACVSVKLLGTWKPLKSKSFPIRKYTCSTTNLHFNTMPFKQAISFSILFTLYFYQNAKGYLDKDLREWWKFTLYHLGFQHKFTLKLT